MEAKESKLVYNREVDSSLYNSSNTFYVGSLDKMNYTEIPNIVFVDCISYSNNSECLELNQTSNETRDNNFDLDAAPDKVYWAVLLVLLPILAVFGNILVILSVYKERSLQTVTNYFIVSLAFADLLVSAVVMPFAVYVLVNVDWELSDTLCDFYIAVDVTSSTASIFNLVAISIDRFIAVTLPIHYAKHKSNKRVFLTIAVVWIVSAAIGSPIVLGLNTSPERIPRLCVFYNSDFIIYSSLSSFYIPCLVMVFLYYKIFKAIHERTKKVIGKKPRPPEKDLIIANTKQLLQETAMDSKISQSDKTAHCSSSERIRGKKVENDECHVIRNEGSREAVNERRTGGTNGQVERRGEEDVKFCEVNVSNEETRAECMDLVVKQNGASPCLEDCGSIAETQKQKKKLFGKKPQPSPTQKKRKEKKKEKNAAKREKKATTTLAIVLGVFLVCWVPFFTCNIMDAICIKLKTDECRPGVTAFLLTTWIGYMNSCVNPVIYTIFNVEFRKAFKKILMEPFK